MNEPAAPVPSCRPGGTRPALRLSSTGKVSVKTLFEPATNLKNKVEKTGATVFLLLTMVKKADEIERRAMQIKERAKGWKGSSPDFGSFTCVDPNSAEVSCGVDLKIEGCFPIFGAPESPSFLRPRTNQTLEVPPRAPAPTRATFFSKMKRNSARITNQDASSLGRWTLIAGRDTPRSPYRTVSRRVEVCLIQFDPECSVVSGKHGLSGPTIFSVGIPWQGKRSHHNTAIQYRLRWLTGF
jgi:hypothetical protein